MAALIMGALRMHRAKTFLTMRVIFGGATVLVLACIVQISYLLAVNQHLTGGDRERMIYWVAVQLVIPLWATVALTLAFWRRT